MVDELFETVLVPIADPADARQTARAVRSHLDPDSEIIVVHVVPKGEGVPDKASLEQREEFAENAYRVFLDVLGRGPGLVGRRTLYGRNVGKTIADGSRELGATAIVFTPRGASRWVKLVTGSVTDNLISNTTVPVLVLPPREDDVAGI
ncbi:universal stress protein [Natronococcus sp. A-GB1]|uniref:universal stress protein n=1 Tax=Natronococcus sp. A-GB1 TaxID=3037648 RepID=UPI00241C60BD|nr:universal stress protein [Natronococcus sp. A-GB1]MDG5760861.1 universal stress protein [Natronococcus sp. A-GB1]